MQISRTLYSFQFSAAANPKNDCQQTHGFSSGIERMQVPSEKGIAPQVGAILPGAILPGAQISLLENNNTRRSTQLPKESNGAHGTDMRESLQHMR